MIQEPSEISQGIHSSLCCIFLVESDQNVVGAITHLLSVQKSLHIFVITSCSEALEVTQHMKPDLFIIDEHLQDGSGSALHDQLQQHKALANIATIIVDKGQLIFPYKGTPEQKIVVTAPFRQETLVSYVTDLATSPNAILQQ